MSCNSLGIDFLATNYFSIDCENGRLRDNTTMLSTATQLKKCNLVPVNKVEVVIPDVGNDELKSIMIKNKEVFGDVDFNSTTQHQTLLRIELTGKGPYGSPRRLCPEKYRIAKQCFDFMIADGVNCGPRCSTSTPDGTSYSTSSPTKEASTRTQLCSQPFPEKVHLTLTPACTILYFAGRFTAKCLMTSFWNKFVG